jgi:nucleotide-binding universal stress UspA family protein
MNILLATDGSAFSDEAAKFLTRFAFSPKDKIVLFHVISEIPYEDEYSKQILRAIKRVSPKILRSCEDALGPVIAQITKEEGQGVPEDEIVKKADELDADLIAMGARGVKGLTSLFLGSVTRKVSALTSKPLLVIKPYRKEAGTGFKILFCTDGSPSAHATAALLSKLPFPADTEMSILTITRSSFADIPDRYAMEVNDAVRDDLMRIRQLRRKKPQ